MKFSFRIIRCAIFASLLFFSCVPVFITPKFEKEPQVRVLLQSEITDSIIITSDKEFTVGRIDMKKGERIVLKKGAPFPKGLFDSPNLILIKPKGKGTLKVGGLEYRGEIEVRRDKGGISIINVLPLEEYLYSVVGCEIGPLNEKNFNAAKAQAIAARTYSINRMIASSHLPYHLHSSPAIDQAYKGKNWETELTRRAVKETRGKIMTYKGRPIVAYYHSTCGGLLNSKEKPYLKALPDTPNHSPGRKPFCSSSPHFSWELQIKGKEFLNLIARGDEKKKGIRIKKITLEKDKRTKRVKRVRFVTNRGKISLSGEEVRKIFRLKSNSFDLKIKGEFVEIKGKGWGHGWGMCQSGALEMAKRGYTTEEILRHYYKGIRIEKVY